MRIAVSSLNDLSEATNQWRPDAVVSVLSPSMRLPPQEGVRYLRLTCHDIEASRYRNLFGPTRPMVERVRALVNNRPERLLLHCAMGLSRSPAFGIVAMIAYGECPMRACDRLKAAVPTASPNRQVLRLAMASLGLSIDLVKYATQTFAYRRTVVGALGAPISWVEVV